MKLRNLLLLPALVLTFAVGMALAQATVPGTSSAEPGSSAGPAGTMNDNAALHQSNSNIRDQIERTYQQHNISGINVDVTNRDVVLTGAVASKSEHDNAVQIARSLGQKHRRIVDHITVAGQNPR